METTHRPRQKGEKAKMVFFSEFWFPFYLCIVGASGQLFLLHSTTSAFSPSFIPLRKRKIPQTHQALKMTAFYPAQKIDKNTCLQFEEGDSPLDLIEFLSEWTV